MPVTEHAPTLALTLAMALIYLLVVRLVDLNEKEPLWAVAMLFAFGAVGAAGVTMGVSAAILDLHTVAGVLLKELVRFLAIAAGVGMLTLVASRRGWSDINGLLDGVVYGAAGGLGFATGEAFLRDLQFTASLTGEIGGRVVPLASWGMAALVGLADGVFGALMGIAFAAAIYARTTWQRMAFPVAGYLGAVLAHLSYDFLGHGNALAGGEGLLRAWAALLLPILIVVGVVVLSLGREKQAIARELEAEAEGQIVTAEELQTLQHFLAREWIYLKNLAKGNFGTWAALRGLHNRQVQLALAKRRLSTEQHASGAKQWNEDEVARLRVAIIKLKNVLAGVPGVASTMSSLAVQMAAQEAAERRARARVGPAKPIGSEDAPESGADAAAAANDSVDEAKSEPAAKTEPATEADAKSEPAVKTEPATEADAKTEPVAKEPEPAKTEPEPAAKTEPVAEEPEPAKTEPEPAAKTGPVAEEPKPAKTKPEPAAETEPVAKAAQGATSKKGAPES